MLNQIFKRLRSQQGLSLFLAIYIGIFLNFSIFFQRFELFLNNDLRLLVEMAATDVIASILFPFLLFTFLGFGGRFFYRITTSFVVVISVIASYYMIFFHAIIGYGVVASTLSTDINLSKEIVGLRLLVWVMLVSVLPLWLIWTKPLQDMPLEKLKAPKQRVKFLSIYLLLIVLLFASIRYTTLRCKTDRMDMNPRYASTLSLAYTPSNWISSLGLFVYTQCNEYFNQMKLFDPAKHFTYNPPASIDDTYIVFIIGETTRWDHMGLLGYKRNTTPLLSKEKNLIAFRGISCDTATGLSLQCMFVREGGAEDNGQRTLKERNVFALLKSLGFTSEIFSMQGLVWFYKLVKADSYTLKEEIVAQTKNRGKPVDDMLLLDQVNYSIERHSQGKHLIILHTNGSHYVYSARYPRSYAHYQPDCLVADQKACSEAELVNSFDNTVLYVDAFIKKVIDRMRDKKALIFYAGDHGESLGPKFFLHGAPRHTAPPEQFRTPIMVWASDKFLANPQHRYDFEQLQMRQQQGHFFRHEEIFDTLLGCLGYTSPDGGINQKNNLCSRVQTLKK